MVSGQPLFHHGFDLAGHETLVARYRIRLLFDEKGHVRVLLEAVAHAIEVQVKTRLSKLAQTRLCRKTVEVWADTGSEQVRLRNSRRKHFLSVRALTTQTAERIEKD